MQWWSSKCQHAQCILLSGFEVQNSSNSVTSNFRKVMRQEVQGQLGEMHINMEDNSTTYINFLAKSFSICKFIHSEEFYIFWAYQIFNEVVPSNSSKKEEKCQDRLLFCQLRKKKWGNKLS